tara:strand:- start:429 stop:959 length:531 start_codon:yes stop_codon:yes gene_type:complete
MAQTDLRKYGTEERLGKMDLDLIDVTVDLGTGALVDGDLFFDTTPIPYAVSVPGGTGLLHSISAIVNSAGGDETANFDIVLTSNSTSIKGDGGQDIADPVSGMDADLSVLKGTCGIASITNLIDAGVAAIGNASNIGIVGKAESDSTTLYCYGIARGGVTYATSPTLTLRFGIVKD